MALENTQKGVTYLTVFSGKLTQRVPEGTPDAVARKNKNDKLVYELTYDKLTGKLVNIEFRETDYGREIVFVLRDKETYRLQQMFSSRVAKSLLTRLPNADLSLPIEIYTGWDIQKECTFAYIKQNDQVVKSAFTKDNPNGMPPMVEIKVKGKATWDDSDQLEFIEKLVNEKILPQIKAAAPQGVESQQEAPELKTGDVNGSDPADDLPF